MDPPHAQQANVAAPTDPASSSSSTKQAKNETKYGDHSSTYWPPGWNYDRYSTASSDELLSLPEGELPKLLAGLREALGERGFAKLAEHQGRLAEARALEAAGFATNESPEWLQQWTRRHRDQPWGFVAFQRICYDDADRWEKFKAQLRKIIEITFERDSGAPDAAAAKAHFEIRWIEDHAMEDASIDMLRERYAELCRDLPSGLSHPVFLCASADAIDSVLSVADTDAAPSTESKRWRAEAPYVLAVSAKADTGLEEGHEEREWIKPVFKVAAEALVDEFWHDVDADIMPLRKMTRDIKGVDLDGRAAAAQDDSLENIWWSMAPSPQRLRKRRRIE